MIQINEVKLPVGHNEEALEHKLRRLLGLTHSEPLTYEIRRRSLDARRKPELFYVYQVLCGVKNEDALLLRIRDKNIHKTISPAYALPAPLSGNRQEREVIVVGAGPAGLFCAYILTLCHARPIVLERGKTIEERRKDVERFWESGLIDPSSNVQFGEGGAGTFSDGKLNTGVRDRDGMIRFVLETFVKFGAPSSILYEAKPHIGTDLLAVVIGGMRSFLEENGCRFLFETQLTDLWIEDDRICGAAIREKGRRERIIATDTVVLAVGHSARDIFQMLYSHRIPLLAKNFAVGFRVEHPQELVDRNTYGTARGELPAAGYKLTASGEGRGVYSFCMCPGGYVVNASSDEGQSVVNGMSYSGRNGSNANSAIIVSVTAADYGTGDALAGMRFQQRLEKEAYLRGNDGIPQQLYGDFREHRASTSYGAFSSAVKGRAGLADLRGLLTPDMERAFLSSMKSFGERFPGFDREDAILSGIESRTSSPVRILRSERMESIVEGLYPCGEGAGYAGGITSAAMDGIRVAEAILQKE